MKAVEIPKIDFKFTDKEKEAVNRMKAVIVIDIPNDIDINRMRIGGDGNIYYMRDGERASIIGNIKNIKPLPQKRESKEEWLNEYHRDEFADGWNACLKVIDETMY